MLDSAGLMLLHMPPIVASRFRNFYHVHGRVGCGVWGVGVWVCGGGGVEVGANTFTNYDEFCKPKYGTLPRARARARAATRCVRPRLPHVAFTTELTQQPKRNGDAMSRTRRSFAAVAHRVNACVHPPRPFMGRAVPRQAGGNAPTFAI